jgi:hypothetical protein
LKKYVDQGIKIKSFQNYFKDVNFKTVSLSRAFQIFLLPSKRAVGVLA